MKKIFITLLLTVIPFFVVAQTIVLPLNYNGKKSGLPAGVKEENLGTDYKQAPYLKFDRKGKKGKVENSSLTFTLPTHDGLTFWYDYKENKSGSSWEGQFLVQFSTNGTDFTDATSTEFIPTNSHDVVRRFVNIPAGITTIKMVYKKEKGNVAIGGLHIEKGISFQVSDAKYATFYSDKNVYLPQNVKASIVETMGNGIKVKELVDQVVNANVPVLLQGEAGTYAAEPDVTATGSNTFAGNLLKGSLTTTTIAAPVGHKLYVLNKGSKGVGFYWEMGTAGNSVNLQAGHAYLSLPISGGAAQGFSLDTPTVTGVEAVETIPSEDAPIYDLSGRRVTTPTHGIYIVGGKKVLK
jgi:hypothetical protein